MGRRETADADQFFSDPGAHVLLRRRYLVTLTDGGTLGIVPFGVVEGQDARDVLPVLERLPRAIGPRRRQLVDLRRVTRYDRAAMEALVAFYGSQSPYLQTVGREAVVRPAGYLGAFAEGFYRAAPVPIDGRAFTDEGDAFGWLVDGGGWGDLPVDEWTRRGPTPLDALQSLVRRAGATLSQTEAARELGLSTRTLQRRLDSVEGGYRGLRRRVLVEEARRLLRTTELPIKAIAFELGYRSPARLTAAFRRETGLTPVRFRALARVDS